MSNLTDIDANELKKKWQKKTPYEHIVDLPDTYIGSIVKERSEQYIVNDVSTENEDGEMVPREMIVKKNMDYVPGIFKIFDEIIVNANDNKNRIDHKITQKEKGHIPMSSLWVSIQKYSDKEQPEKYCIQVKNDGDGIDVAEHPTEKVWVPQMIFGELLTSGNYDKAEEKVTGGKNGYGAKLTNIFSTYFCVETVDKKRKLKYKQVYRHKMKTKEKPIIEKYNGKPYTSITFVPDYQQFGLDDLTDDLIALFKKRTYDMVYCSQNKLKVYFNDKLINPTNDKYQYMHYYLPDVETTLAYANPHERWQIGACMSPNFQFQNIAFVNGIYTSRGGRHVDYVVKQITQGLVRWIAKKKKVSVRESFIKDNLLVFVNSLIVNPSFDSQTKETLTTNQRDFGSKFTVPEEFIETIAKTGIVDRALAQNQFQESQTLKKTDGKKTKRILDIEKLEDARFAGTKKAAQCTLILTEGDSAKATAVTGISSLEKGRDFYGIFPLRGKLLNTRDKKDKEIAGNAEIVNIKRILGLQEGTEYKDIGKLRYGRIMIMTDQDVDGSHIKGLVINYISSSFPSLLQVNGFITSLLTPIVKAWKKGKKDKAHNFYTLPDYDNWLQQHDGGRGYQTKYYKGLGTSTPQEARQYFQDYKLVTYHWEEESNESIDKAFNKERADDRKSWLLQYSDQILDLGQMSVSFSDFIDKDLILFSIADNKRSIPSVMDGLKPSTRKILYCSFKRNLIHEIKVAQLAGYVSENGAYHHGEASLHGAIVGMAQNYPGTNNINLLVPEGQFGTRLQGGKDFAAPRYIFTYLTALTNKIYRKEDNPIYKYTTDDGQVVEPEYYAPVIPMLLVNGTDGIGTGWSSKVPQFNPMDLVKAIKSKIKGEKVKELIPWYRGFKGDIFKVGKNQWMTRGKYNIIDGKTVEITELPIGTWTNNYKSMLDKMVIGIEIKEDAKGKKGVVHKSIKSKKTNVTGRSGISKVDNTDLKLLKDYINESSDVEIKFRLIFEPNMLSKLLGKNDKNGVNEFERRFKLTSKLSCNKTLNFFSHENKLLNLETIDDILENYYTHRMLVYGARKEYQVETMTETLELISVKVKFILDIINKVVKINNVAKAEIIEQLEKLKYPKMLEGKLISLEKLTKKSSKQKQDASYQFLISMPIYNLTKDKIEELKKEKDRVETDLTTLKGKTSGDIWLEDLVEFEEEYSKFMKKYYKYYSLKEKEFSNNCRKAPKKDIGSIMSSKF